MDFFDQISTNRKIKKSRTKYETKLNIRKILDGQKSLSTIKMKIVGAGQQKRRPKDTEFFEIKFTSTHLSMLSN